MAPFTYLFCCPLILNAPAPGVPPVVEADGLRLEIFGTAKFGMKAGATANDYLIKLILENKKQELRSIDYLRSHGNRLDYSYGITYFFWFPDGTLFELTPALNPFENPKGRDLPYLPLALPAGGSALGSRSIGFAIEAGDAFWKAFKKNEGKFCLTAVIGFAGVQSNTIPYNGCPLPPASYRPVRKSRNTPEAKRARELQIELQFLKDKFEFEMDAIRRYYMRRPPPK